MVGVTPFTRPQSLSDSVAMHLRDYFASHNGELPPPELYDRVLAEVERPLIEICLAACKGNQIKAAELLGINRNTLRKKIKALGIVVSRGSNQQQEEVITLREAA